MQEKSRNRRLVVVGLKEAVVRIARSAHSQSDSRLLVTTTRALASELLIFKLQSNPSLQKITGLSIEDLAYDCIADLYERDRAGAFIHFHTYFSSFDTQKFSDAEALLQLRRLVSSAVNQNLTHILGDHDPILRKIIRNIRLSMAAHKTFEEVERFDETCIIPTDCASNEHLPEYDRQELVAMLVSNIQGDEFIPEMLAILSRSLRAQTDHSRIIPFIDVALSFRSAIVMKQQQPSAELAHPSSDFELQDVIKKTVSNISMMMAHRSRAVTNRADELTPKYFLAVESVLLSRINGSNGSVDSLFEGLRQAMPHLTEKDYRTHHRTRLEYIYRLCRSALASELLDG